jgi:hypothetical protein
MPNGRDPGPWFVETLATAAALAMCGLTFVAPPAAAIGGCIGVCTGFFAAAWAADKYSDREKRVFSSLSY